MEDEAPEQTAELPTRDLDFAQAQLAYSIIESLLDHTRVVSDLIALMAQTLDEDTTKSAHADAGVDCLSRQPPLARTHARGC